MTGSQLRERRKACGLTLMDMERLSGVTVTVLSRIERGYTLRPHRLTQQAILRVLLEAEKAKEAKP